MYKYDVNSAEQIITGAHKLVLECVAHATDITQIIDSCHENDLRPFVFKRFAVIIHNYMLSFFFIKDSLLHYAWWDSIGYSNLTNEQKMVNASSFFESTTFSTFHALYMVCESSLRLLNKAFDSTVLDESTGGIYKVRKHLYENFLSISYSQHSNFYQFTSLIRNCTHNGGVYRNPNLPNLSVNYRGNSYSFTHNQPPNFISVELMFELSRDSIQVMYEIILDPNVISLPFIEDLYNRLYQTHPIL
ncbi:hypothetical protein H6F89_06590 [Cyanobacteria bacterium FACHB-63]|nr:hypothetical protein [Cyanobacteria bacterium FACHB-63]